MNPKLLIVDDDEDIRSQMKWALAQDYQVVLAEDRTAAIKAFREHRPMVVLLDLGLPPNPAGPEEGLATLTEMLEVDRFAKVIIVTGQGEKENALRAVGNGAYHFLCKPVEIDEVKALLKMGFYLAQLEKENREMQKLGSGDNFEGMLGGSPHMQDVFSTIRKVATTDAPVLILGESGTGKEMTALAIHHRSGRKDGPFIAINCGAIPENLLESELFGHEKGSFTGAHVQRQGRIETANGGTLFLDELGELPQPLQVKLLRFLQEQYIERVGGREKIKVDARIVAATNSDLTKAMAAGSFREDLYYRLAVVVVKVPPLRQREQDILLLAQAFLQKFSAQNNKSVAKFSKEAIRALQQHDWPGNVRELENRVKRAVIMGDHNAILPADLELSHIVGSSIRTLKDAREELEREMILIALRRHNGKVSPAATDLGISRPTLYELMDKLSIKRDSATT
jgi:two-component system NtrC family response regulator